MKSTKQLLFMFLLLSGTTFSQDITTWIEHHPHVLLINAKDASEEFLEKLDQKAADYILYSDAFTYRDIERYERDQSAQPESPLINAKSDEAEFVKVWLTENQHVKIIPNDLYASMPSTDQQGYSAKETLILDGNYITLSDIERFENARTQLPVNESLGL